MKKNQIADLSSISKNKIDQPSSDTKKKEAMKKEAMKKQNKASPNQAELINLQQFSQKSSIDQDNQNESIQNYPMNQRVQNQLSQDTSKLTNPTNSQPPKQKKKLRGILVAEDQAKKVAKPQQTAEERKDHHGVPITKGPNKHHRICFNPQIQEVYEVENWKEYNMEEKYGICSCRCNTFQMMLLAILAM